MIANLMQKAPDIVRENRKDIDAYAARKSK